MRQFSAIKINYTLNINFPRLTTQAPHFSGLASERGTRERAWIGRFCHFFGGRGFKPGRDHETKKCYFFFFLFGLRKEKPDNHTKQSKSLPSAGILVTKSKVGHNSPKGIQGLWCHFFSCFTRLCQNIGAPRGDFRLPFSAHLTLKRLLNSSCPTVAVQTKVDYRFSCSLNSLPKRFN